MGSQELFDSELFNSFSDFVYDITEFNGFRQINHYHEEDTNRRQSGNSYCAILELHPNSIQRRQKNVRSKRIVMYGLD